MLKETYEQWTGDSMTWGEFLITVTVPAATSAGMTGQPVTTEDAKTD